jgi:ABC-type nickel/cobalt efflux system permease component RcnA
MFTTSTAWMLGLLRGMQHAMEPDHLAAVSTMATERPSVRSGLALGLFWGLGHSMALLLVGVVLAMLQKQLPPSIADLLEFGVALMLVLLGIRSIRRSLVSGRSGEVRSHAHFEHHHEHAGPARHLHLGRWTFATRPLLIGIVHGLAGSGALTALVVSSLSSTFSRLAYIAVFGLGSVGGMALLTGFAGWPMGRIGRSPRAAAILAGLTGAISVILGLIWGSPLALRWLR